MQENMPPTPRQTAKSRLSKAFAEWHRRHAEDPKAFDKEWKSLESKTYGERCAEYLTKLLDEIDNHA